MEKYLIRVAQESDAKEIFDFKVRHVNSSNPLELAHPGKSVKPQNSSFIAVAIKSNFVLMAIESSTKNLVGILIAEPVNQNFFRDIKSLAALPGDTKRSDILNCVIYAEEKANIFKKCNVTDAIYVEVIGVHPAHRRQKIAQKLLKTSIDSARSENFKIIFTDCTSLFSAKVAESLGMNCVSVVTYDEYNDYLGKHLFTPIKPHTEIKTFVKMP